MKKIIKIFFIVVLAVIIGALLLRIAVSCDRSVYDDLEISEAARNVYKSKGDLTVYTVKKLESTRGKGYFSAYALYYEPETGELQVTVKYNESAFNYTDTNSNDGFVFKVYNETDGKYYEAVSEEKTEKWKIYNFVKLKFEGVEIGTEDLAHIVMMNTGDGELDSLTFHYSWQDFNPYKLSNSDRRNLEN